MDAEVTFPTVSRRGAGAARTARSGPHPAIVASTAAFHIGVIAVLCLSGHPRLLSPPPVETGIPVVFVPEAGQRAEAEQQLASGILPAPVGQEAETVAPPPPVALPPREMGAMPRAASGKLRAGRSLAMAAAISGRLHGRTPAPQAVSAPPEHPVVAPAPPAQDLLPVMARWESRIRDAVQAAASYPTAARLLRRTGSAQVRFDYDRGLIERAAIARSSHVGALDDAAMAAVARAAIPDPPAELGPQQRTMLVWVQFTLLPPE